MFVAQGLAPMPPAQMFQRRVRGPGTDEPLVWYEGSATSDRRWLLADERGSVIAVTNSAGSAQAINSYDAYGIPAASNLGRFQYTGQAWIAEIGMYDYKARTYSATLGRFLQTDPIGYGDQNNLYAYVGNDPVNNVDPNGQFLFAALALFTVTAAKVTATAVAIKAVAATVVVAGTAAAAASAGSGAAGNNAGGQNQASTKDPNEIVVNGS